MERIERSDGMVWRAITMIVTLVSLMGAATASAAQTCEPQWATDTFGIPGVGGVPVAAVMFDDGSGPALYVGGGFKAAGSSVARNVARWDGSEWASVGDGLEGHVNALTVFDDGGGPALYAARSMVTADGQWISGLVMWDGGAWSAIGGQIGSERGDIVTTLEVFDDGRGPALYVGGQFTRAGEVEALNIARWDGHEWSALGDGVGGYVRDMAVWHGATEPVLVVGGQYMSTTGADRGGLVTWNGSDWGNFGTGVRYFGNVVNALAVYDDGRGRALYVGGYYGEMNGLPIRNLARWDGSDWSAVGEPADAGVTSLLVADTGQGPSLFVAGAFEQIGSLPTGGMARWDGAAWHALSDSPVASSPRWHN